MSVLTGALILAAGKGTRMYSDIPKVLQRILDEPMLRYVYDAVVPVCPQHTWTVVGHKAEMVQKTFPAHAPHCIVQEQQLGTGHALQVAWPSLAQGGITHLLVINGDTPLLSEAAIRKFLAASLAAEADLAFITLTLDDPAAFGRVLRRNSEKDADVLAIIEAKDYDISLHGEEPREINAGIYCLRMAAVEKLLPRLQNTNKSGEFYITDLVGLAVKDSLRVLGYNCGNDPQLLGINNPAELVRSEELIRTRIVNEFLNAGVIIHAPHMVRIGPDVTIEPGVSITGPTEVYGKTTIERGCVIASHCRLHTVTMQANAVMHSFTHAETAGIGPRCIVGPYARLRPGAVLDEEAHVGNFVEIKKSHLAKGAKANHLSYIGDAEVGARVNIGAGTITCNYDGIHKHTTHIGEGAFIGSNTALVAPVTIGSNALVGAGSVITTDVPERNLALARSRQVNILRRK